MEAEKVKNDNQGVGRMLVFLPFPLQGHINPMLQLAVLLHTQGFSITIIHTNHYIPDPSMFPSDFTFIPISISGDTPQSHQATSRIVLINKNIEAPLTRLMTKMMKMEEKDQVPSCLIADFLMYSSRSVSENVGVSRLVLRTGSAACFRIFMEFPMLFQKGYYPIQDSRRDDVVEQLPPFRVRDLPNLQSDKTNEFYQIMNKMVDAVRTSRGLVINTMKALECTPILELESNLEMDGLQVFPVGPLHRFSPDTECTLWTQDDTCISWLDQSKSPKSVLYVSFGSLAIMNRHDFLEIAWGIANSGQAFLWVLRHDSIEGGADFPDEFLKVVEERGKVVEWAPQQQVLRHPSVGGFWTHCGWNSTLESICEGVSLFCRPYFGDQMANSRLLTHVWRVGIPLENEMVRGEIERAVRMLLVEREGEELRRRMMEKKIEADKCMLDGGADSPKHYLNKIAELIVSFNFNP